MREGRIVVAAMTASRSVDSVPRSVAVLSALLPAAVLSVGLTACDSGEDPAGRAPSKESASATADSGEVQRGPWSVLLITLDTTRADHLAPYGAEEAETPHLASLAREGVLFEHAYAVTPVTLPSHATLLTGLEPPRHGVRNNGIHHLEESMVTLPERLAEAGWRTAAFVSAAVLERRYGLAQGFELYDDDLSGGGPRELRSMTERPASATVDAARAWLDALAPGERFFLWVHLFDPHAPYAPPTEWAERFPDTPYDGEIAFMDAEIGRLLSHPRLAAPLVTVAVGDHGEALGEHGEQTHGMLVYDSTMRVPFVLRLPQGPRGLRVETPVSQTDLVPTLVDLLELPDPAAPPDAGSVDGPAEATAGSFGRSLLPLLGGEAWRRRPLYGESHVAFHAYGWARLHTVWREGWKYIEAPTRELYDLGRDPGETENLAAERRERVAELAAVVERRTGGVSQREAALAPDREADRRLRSLGYLTAAGRRPEGAPRPDPKEVIGVHEDLQRVGVLLQTRRFTEAIRELRSVLARDPGNPTALRDLARSLAETGRFDDAMAALERALSLDPSSPTLHLALADLEARRGAASEVSPEDGLERALEWVDTALALDPRSQEAQLDKARYLQALGRDEEARRLMEEILDGSADPPNNPWVEVRHAELVELPSGDLEGAERRLRRAAERDPNLVDAWLLLGDVLERSDRPAAAAEVYRRALEHQPRAVELHTRLGRLLAEVGDPGAAPALERALELAREQSSEPPADLLQNLAALALQRRDWPEAERLARGAVERDPSLAAAWNSLGIAREEQGRAGEAAAAYRRAEEEDPGYWQASFNAGLLLARQQRFREAAAAFEAVLARVPDHAGAHFHLGSLQAGPLNEPAQARDHLLRALQTEPDHPRARRIREILSRLPPSRGRPSHGHLSPAGSPATGSPPDPPAPA